MRAMGVAVTALGVFAALTCAVTGSSAASTVDSMMRVASLQHVTTKTAGNSAKEDISANMAAYIAVMKKQQTKSAQKGGEVDLFVFPELGLGRNELLRFENAKFGENIPDAVFENRFVVCTSSGMFRNVVRVSDDFCAPF
jgi:hypothetical protein